MSQFDEILITTQSDDSDNIRRLVEKRREYNRKYQAKLREKAKLVTLEKRIEANLHYVIGYIKQRHDDAYQKWQPLQRGPAKKPGSAVPEEFKDWFFVFALDHYSSINSAYNVSGLQMSIDDFTRFFTANYVRTEEGYEKKR